MTQEEFETLVARLEREARDKPGPYRLKVLLLAALGNLYLGVVLLLVVALLVALLASIMVLKALAVKFILIVGIFLWMIIKALWVKVDPPGGLEIKAPQATALFAMMDEMRRQLDAPPFHHVLITDEFNAGVVQVPRLGIFGWPRNFLLLGLPLLKGLTTMQFKAVLAHEYGHLARGHGRTSNWVYRQRLRWNQLLGVLDANESKGSFLFKPFLRRFAPYFMAYSFPLARANEYEADATSARLTSRRIAAEALSGVSVVGGYLAERYWPKIFRLADDQPQPGFAPYVEIGRGVNQDLDASSAQTWLDQAMARQTDLTDTHPALADRIRALGESPRLALPAMGESADRLLDGALQDITERLDQSWRAAISPSWERRHQEVQEGRRRLADLRIQLQREGTLGVQDAYELARLTEDPGDDPEDALAQYRVLHARAPDDAQISFTLGARLLSRDDAAGQVLIEQAMHLDEDAIVKRCELLREFHWRQGDQSEAQAWHARLVERLELQAAAAKERSWVRLSDKLEHHGLPDPERAGLREALRNIPGLYRAYLVRKQVTYFPHRPLFVLGYRATKWYQMYNKQRAQEVSRRIRESVPFPGETLIISVDGNNYRFGRKFHWMHGARIL